MTDEYLTIPEACTLVHVSRRTIYNWLHAGLIDAIRIPSGSLRIRRASLIIDVVLRKPQPVQNPSAPSIPAPETNTGVLLKS
jgi:excisionase family DNA binding protein